MSKKKIIPLLLIIAAVAGGTWYWQQQKPKAEADHLTLYGNVDIREAQMTFNGSEHVAQILVQEGDTVHKGQLLARLDTPLLEAQLAQAEANLGVKQALLKKLQAGSRPEEIDRGKAELEAAQAKARSARDSARRLQDLVRKNLASQDAYETARGVADAAQAQARAADRTLALLLAGPRKEDIAAAYAQQVAAEAEVALAKQHLEDARLLAPADGVIRDRILEPGDMASPQTPVLTLAFTDPVWVRAYLPETDLGKVPPGALAQIHSDSYPDKPYEGWVGYISPTAEFTPKNVETPDLRTRLVYSTRIYACNPQQELRLGMPVTVTLALGQKPQNQKNQDQKNQDQNSRASHHCAGHE